MKTLKKISLALGIVLIFTGCDVFSDLLTITIKDVKITKKFDFNITPLLKTNGDRVISGSYQFADSATVQLNQSDTLKNYLEHIKSVKIDSITCKLTGVESGVIQSLELTVRPLNITKSLNNPEPNSELYVSFTDEEFKSIANALLASQELKFILKGVVNKAPVTFSVAVTVDADFVVKIIK
ncbi:MAG: hypothetical protein Q7U47_14985 [Paludibacter sp.]|nr:hypothetical protein [Paludibacter sp.]